MAEEVQLDTFLTIPSLTTEFLIILYWLMNHLQKILRIFETGTLVHNNLCGKLISLLELSTTSDECFKFTSVPFFLDF